MRVTRPTPGRWWWRPGSPVERPGPERTVPGQRDDAIARQREVADARLVEQGPRTAPVGDVDLYHAGRRGRVQQPPILVEREGGHRLRDRVHDAAAGVIPTRQSVRAADPEGARALPTVVPPWPLVERVRHADAELAHADDLVITQERDTHRHRVLGQVWVGPLVDVVWLAVPPVLEELRRGPGVIELVEVHRAWLVEPEPAADESEQQDRRHEDDVDAVESAAVLTRWYRE